MNMKKVDIVLVTIIAIIIPSFLGFVAGKQYQKGAAARESQERAEVMSATNAKIVKTLCAEYPNEEFCVHPPEGGVDASECFTNRKGAHNFVFSPNGPSNDWAPPVCGEFGTGGVVDLEHLQLGGSKAKLVAVPQGLVASSPKGFSVKSVAFVVKLLMEANGAEKEVANIPAVSVQEMSEDEKTAASMAIGLYNALTALHSEQVVAEKSRILAECKQWEHNEMVPKRCAAVWAPPPPVGDVGSNAQ